MMMMMTRYMFPCLLLFASLGHSEMLTSDLSSHGDNPSADIDLASYLRLKTQQQDNIFTEAVQLLESMKTSPSCNRIAASRLLSSCQSIESQIDAETSTYLALEHVRSLYAARLALCELNGAGISIPPPCLPVTLTLPPKKSLFGFTFKPHSSGNIADSVPTGVLEFCLRSLESRPQWWTSYSNCRQNAMVICQATRLESEKDELLDLHKSIVQSSIKLSHGLQKALHTAAEESSERRAFVQTTTALQERLTRELETTESRFKTMLGSYFRDIEKTVNSVLTIFTSVLARVQTEATSLEKEIRNTTGEVGFLRQMLQALHDEVLFRNAQMVDLHQERSDDLHELALSLKSRLESFLQDDMARISQNVQVFDSSLEWLSERMEIVLQKELTIIERLRNFESSLGASELKAENLHKAQLQQLEALQAQYKLHKYMENNFQISQALLEKATVTAANLQAMIDETTTRYRESPIVNSFFRPHSAWTVCGLLLSFMAAYNPRVALVALLIGTIHLAMTFLY